MLTDPGYIYLNVRNPCVHGGIHAFMVESMCSRGNRCVHGGIHAFTGVDGFTYKDCAAPYSGNPGREC